MYPLVKKDGVILEKTERSFENEGGFNPAAIREDEFLHILYRAIAFRKCNFSSIGYCKLDGPLDIIERSTNPIFSSGNSQEFKGTEDPRITKIEDTYYLSFAAFDGVNVFGAYATSKDLKTFERKGIITPKFTFNEYAAQTSPDGLIYYAAAALLDIDNPCKVLDHLKKLLFEPTEPYEKVGVFNNVVFPSGSALLNDELYIFYGAVDLSTAVDSMSIRTLLNELKHQKN